MTVIFIMDFSGWDGGSWCPLDFCGTLRQELLCHVCASIIVNKCRVRHRHHIHVDVMQRFMWTAHTFSHPQPESTLLQFSMKLLNLFARLLALQIQHRVLCVIFSKIHATYPRDDRGTEIWNLNNYITNVRFPSLVTHWNNPIFGATTSQHESGLIYDGANVTRTNAPSQMCVCVRNKN